jgi:putative ABC transport system substrate-binding protein
MHDLSRRGIMGMVGGAAAWPVAARAQPKPATVGILVSGNPTPALLEGFRTALRTVGLVEGHNIRLAVRSAEGSEALLQKAIELVRLNVDVIIASLTPAVQAARHATSDIPIVMAAAGDPVATGLISSLARPGGNITGVSGAAVETAGKRLEHLREFFPAAHRVAVLANEADPFSAPFVTQLSNARSLGVEIEALLVPPDAAHDRAFATMRDKQVDAFIIELGTIRPETSELAVKHRLPSSGPRAWPAAGGLIGYSGNVADTQRLAADYVDKILKGRKPADLPVALPTRFDLVINLKTAKALRLEVPPTLLARADEVIE